MSKTKHNGNTLKSLFQEHNVSVSRMMTLSGRSRQQIHNDFNRVTIKDDVLAVYAKALNLTLEDLFEILKQEDKNSSSYLIEHLENLEQQFKMLLQQLEVKDRQLELKDKQLEKLIDILGKHKDELQMTPESNLRIAA